MQWRWWPFLSTGGRSELCAGLFPFSTRLPALSRGCPLFTWNINMKVLVLLCCDAGGERRRRSEHRVHAIKHFKYINYKWEHYTYVSYKQTGSQTRGFNLKCPHYNTDVQEVFFLLFFPLHNWLHVAQNSSFSHGGKDIKGNENCVRAS